MLDRKAVREFLEEALEEIEISKYIFAKRERRSIIRKEIYKTYGNKA